MQRIFVLVVLILASSLMVLCQSPMAPRKQSSDGVDQVEIDYFIFS
jgi:hypothetical protein